MLKDEAALGGNLNIATPKKLTIEFNCLGIAVLNAMVLHIEVPFHEPIKLFINKECSHETFLDRLEEKIVDEEEEYGVLKFLGMCLFLCGILYLAVTCYNLYQGKPLIQSVPFGSTLILKVIGQDTAKNEPAAAAVPSTDSFRNVKVSEMTVPFWGRRKN